MCGIVGYIGLRDAKEVILTGLSHLEYRGYDSAGIATLHSGQFEVRRSTGKLANLIAKVNALPVQGKQGIGHTRWATHGGISEQNAHPQMSSLQEVAVVHNGMLENYPELKERLVQQGVNLTSQTDTELIAHLIERNELETKDFSEAFRKTMQELKGGNVIVAMHKRYPGTLIAARLGYAGAVVISAGEDEVLLASDIPAVLTLKREVMFLEAGEMVVAKSNKAGTVYYQITDGKNISKIAIPVTTEAKPPEKGKYRHFMEKEIFEQPTVLKSLLENYINSKGELVLDDLQLNDEELHRVDKIYAVGCGSAWHACLLGKHFVENLAGIRLEVEVGSEFRYRKMLLDKSSLLIAVSQSGETADTLAAMEVARQVGVKTIGLVNVLGSQAARLADGGTIYLKAGAEVGVASTKAYTNMVIAFYLLALKLAQVHGRLDRNTMLLHIEALQKLPAQIDALLQNSQKYQELAEQYYRSSDMLYLGRWLHYSTALEGALKMKEISYLHAEAYPAGELKHGPLALVGEATPVVCIAVRNQVYEKMLSTIEQVQARGGAAIVVANEGDDLIPGKASWVVFVPVTQSELLSPVLVNIPLQLFAYYTAVLKGNDVDQPRNLAKSVTVE